MSRSALTRELEQTNASDLLHEEFDDLAAKDRVNSVVVGTWMVIDTLWTSGCIRRCDDVALAHGQLGRCDCGV
eukprot:CAMPEP_0197428560 /NCGR_PEP_ID=MMETSP1170-20131217/41439_1 /TAXON_ID=54406 /ORGANISM="Sarcinochrysis sp, Strain CCMP770" /LENGTH=72 /DNA_ID=CAMNT_0042956331 /DNA_START=146 /DNA_END=364 /DNA_ORIENTATION=-